MNRPGSGTRAPAWRAIPPTVVALGVVSLLTDLSSEMIYPLLPVFLVEVLGAGAVVLGLIEGVAETTAALLKIWSGWLTDRVGRRKPLVVAGYTLSSAARPLMGAVGAWPGVVVLRFLDRVGKGVRTSPRDALIADITEQGKRGTAYGFHRAMDHVGAVAGPLVAAGLLLLPGMSLRGVFYLAAVPAIAAVLVLVLAVREPARPDPSTPSEGETPVKIGALGRNYRTLLIGVVIFTLGNSTDAFLLLRFSETGLTAGLIAVLWSVHHVVKVASTWIGGRLSDRIGPRPMVVAGWLLYAAVYMGFALTADRVALIGLFLIYGVYYGLTEPSEKSWVATIAPSRVRGRAFGLYHGSVGIAALPASLIFGLLYQQLGAPLAFATGAALALIATLVVSTIPTRRMSNPL